eukprot:gnl/Chilomastix_cuspidata/4183.p1 GENE.gnl/Chilomastix_cuspidata/4183~~gnl/Chilomastix_cuspidata/4183.p1  ORF type:complete len:956 (-),score=102.82 gnl/Chilomastix_cuspidata/4183:49-2916(-)
MSHADAQGSRGPSRPPQDLDPFRSFHNEQESLQARMCVVSIIESRSRELAVSYIRGDSTTLIVNYFTDNPFYINTVSTLKAISPTVIVFPDSLADSPLIDILKVSEIGHEQLISLPRSYFNDTRGATILGDKSPNALDTIISSYSYLILCSMGATVRYLETQNNFLTSSILRVKVSAPKRYMTVDPATVRVLEVLVSRNTDLPLQIRKKKSLFGILNRCKTVAGARMLRLNLLQPPCHLPTIEGRLDALQEILANKQLFFGLQMLLPTTPDIEATLSKLTRARTRPTLNAASETVRSVLSIRDSVIAGFRIAEKLKVCRADLLVIAANSMKNPVLLEIVKRINTVIHESVQLKAPSEEASLEAKKTPVTTPGTIISNTGTPRTPAERLVAHSRAITQKIPGLDLSMTMAVMPGVHQLLDVARMALSESLDDILKLVDELKEKKGLSKLSVRYNESRKFWLELPSSRARSLTSSRRISVPTPLSTPSAQILPKDAINITFKRGKLFFSTEELVSLSGRFNDSLTEIKLMTDRALAETVTGAIIPAAQQLLQLGEALAVVDMQFALATYLSEGEECVRPQFCKAKGPFALKQARHPILERILEEECVPNDAFLSASTPMSIITGENASGKTTYLQSIALNIILAHIGCFLPASFASIPLTTALFAPTGTDCDTCGSMSTFHTEMRTISQILENCDASTLVLMDELGRGTCPSEGAAIAWAVCEKLLERESYAFLVTHFQELTLLPTAQSGTRNLHFSSPMSDGARKYSIQPDANESRQYGLRAAAASGWRADILADAHKTWEVLNKAAEKPARVKREELKFSVAKRLLSVQDSTLSDNALAGWLREQQKLVFPVALSQGAPPDAVEEPSAPDPQEQPSPAPPPPRQRTPSPEPLVPRSMDLFEETPSLLKSPVEELFSNSFLRSKPGLPPARRPALPAKRTAGGDVADLFEEHPLLL